MIIFFQDANIGNNEEEDKARNVQNDSTNISAFLLSVEIKNWSWWWSTGVKKLQEC